MHNKRSLNSIVDSGLLVLIKTYELFRFYVDLILVTGIIITQGIIISTYSYADLDFTFVSPLKVNG